MPTKEELLEAIDKYRKEEPTYQNCVKIATFTWLLDRFYGSGPAMDGYSRKQAQNGYQSDSEFMQLVEKSDSDHLFAVLDELFDTIRVLNPRLYNSAIRKLKN